MAGTEGINPQYVDEWNHSGLGHLLVEQAYAIRVNASQDVLDAIETEVVQAEDFDFTY